MLENMAGPASPALRLLGTAAMRTSASEDAVDRADPRFDQDTRQLQVIWSEPCVLGDSGEHSRTDFISVMKGENVVSETGAGERPM
jgi:hypothetical protein